MRIDLQSQLTVSGNAFAEAQRLESVVSPEKAKKSRDQVHAERVQMSEQLIQDTITVMTEEGFPSLERLQKKHKASVKIPVFSRDDEKNKSKVSNLHKFAEGKMNATNVCAFSIGKILYGKQNQFKRKFTQSDLAEFFSISTGSVSNYLSLYRIIEPAGDAGLRFLYVCPESWTTLKSLLVSLPNTTPKQNQTYLSLVVNKLAEVRPLFLLYFSLFSLWVSQQQSTNFKQHIRIHDSTTTHQVSNSLVPLGTECSQCLRRDLSVCELYEQRL